MIKKYLFPTVSLLSSMTLGVAHAQCPICTAAVIGGVGLARWLKIDDTVTGLWIGGLLVSTSLWTINWLKSKKWNFYQDGILIPIFYYVTVIVPLYYYNIIGHPLNVFWGIDKLILGMIFGSILFYAMVLRYEQIKKKNNNHAQFPYQRVVMPVGILIILSGIFYFATRISPR